MTSEAKVAIRTYQKGDAAHMVLIYNTVMKDMPGFQADSVERLERLYAGPDFEPASKFFALDGEQVVGYMTVTPDLADSRRGELNYPYVLPGYVGAARESLFKAAMRWLKEKGIHDLGTAYFHEAWEEQVRFLEARGFRKSPVSYRVLESAMPPQRDLPEYGPYNLRPADSADFEELSDIHYLAPGKCADPPHLSAAHFKRFSAAPFVAREGISVADRGGRLAGFTLAYVQAEPELGGLAVGTLQGPLMRPEEWDSPAREALWINAIEVLRKLGAEHLRAYVADAGTPETEQLFGLYAGRGFKGHEVWVELRKTL